MILSERFGNNWRLVRQQNSIRLELSGMRGAIIFDKLQQNWFNKKHSDISCAKWCAKREGWLTVLDDSLAAPGVARLPAPLVEPYCGEYLVHYDIIGFVYWMLARIEEISRKDLDYHHRFPATSSHAYRHNYLDRPIVDEWLHVLGQIMQRQWPGLVLRKHKFRMYVSHDVDRPSRYGFASWRNTMRRMAGDLVRGNPGSALSGPWVRMSSNKKRIHPSDPFNTFDWIMEQSERYGLTSAFNFICGHTSTMDGEYQIEHPAICNLLQCIHVRGHEIGLHPSYNTYDKPDTLKAEAYRLKKICAENGIHQETWGGRMHYLRWKHPLTLRAWNSAGMDYDSTLGYADHAGFRCGTCFEYPGYDPIEGEILSVRIRPLIAMEVSVLNKQYMDLSKANALATFSDLKYKCKKVRGQFTLLWHNSELSPYQQHFYEEVLGS